MALDSDKMIENQSLDWLGIMLVAVSRFMESGRTLSIRDLKALRSTCKAVKALLAPFFVKLKIEIPYISPTSRVWLHLLYLTISVSWIFYTRTMR